MKAAAHLLVVGSMFSSVFSVLLFLQCLLIGQHGKVAAVLNHYTEEEQRSLLLQAAEACYWRIYADNNTSINSTGCPVSFDDVVCWPAAEANTTITIPCPGYVNLLDTEESATRFCNQNGTWEINLIKSYEKCVEKSRQVQRITDELYDVEVAFPSPDEEMNPMTQKHATTLEVIYTVGNTLSVIALLVALMLFASFRLLGSVKYYKRQEETLSAEVQSTHGKVGDRKLLRSRRNIIHVNLFVSFVLRGVFTMLHFYVTAKQDNNLEQNPKLSLNFSLVITETHSNWECKLLSSLWEYMRLSNYIWIFMEALYLHLVIFVLTFNERQYGLRIMIFGWCTPMVFIIPWVITRVKLDDYKCWVRYSNQNIRYILEVPTILIVLVNFGFFINFIKLLATKLRASQTSGYKQSISRRLAKSTAVLIPLFGIHYIVFIFLEFSPQLRQKGAWEIVYLYFTTIFTSMQGLAVAVLFCFCNGEVITEIQKKWTRLQQQTEFSDEFKRQQFGRTQLRPRISLTSDTGFTYLPRRASSGNGSLALGLIPPKSPSASYSRKPSITSPITPIAEEQCVLLEQEQKLDQNRNFFAFDIQNVK